MTHKFIANAINKLFARFRKGEPKEEPRSEARKEFMQDVFDQDKNLASLGLLAASIEHQIKNPLGVMEVEIYRMRRRFQANLEIVEGLRRIDEQRMRVLAAMRIVHLFRGNADFYQKFMENTSVKDVITRSIKVVKEEMNLGNIFIKIKDSSSLDSNHKPTHFIVRAYRIMLQEALVHILKNSIEAIWEANRESGIITIELRRDHYSPHLVKIDIKDNGCGIPPENIALLTTLFTTKKDQKPNSGIGLLMVDKIAQLHNGRVEIKSVLGEGTTVTILLPRAPRRSKNTP